MASVHFFLNWEGQPTSCRRAGLFKAQVTGILVHERVHSNRGAGVRDESRAQRLVRRGKHEILAAFQSQSLKKIARDHLGKNLRRQFMPNELLPLSRQPAGL